MRQEDEIAEALGGFLVGKRTLAGGFSHETVLLELADRRVVARFGGGDPFVEARVMEAASAYVPVPPVLLVRPDVMVIGFVEGTPLGDVLDRGGPVRAMRELGEAVGRTAARVGEVRFDRPGFFEKGGDGLTVNQDEPWSAQLPGVAEWCMGRVQADRLDAATRQAWIDLCAEHAPALRAVDDEARLVHADLNPKNILIAADNTVAALLDWEFSFSGPPAADAGNMARFAGDYPDGVLAGFGEPDHVAYVLDMFALSDLTTRPAGNPVADAAAEVIREWTRNGVPGNGSAAPRKRAGHNRPM